MMKIFPFFLLLSVNALLFGKEDGDQLDNQDSLSPAIQSHKIANDKNFEKDWIGDFYRGGYSEDPEQSPSPKKRKRKTDLNPLGSSEFKNDLKKTHKKIQTHFEKTKKLANLLFTQAMECYAWDTAQNAIQILQRIAPNESVTDKIHVHLLKKASCNIETLEEILIKEVWTAEIKEMPWVYYQNAMDDMKEYKCQKLQKSADIFFKYALLVQNKYALQEHWQDREEHLNVFEAIVMLKDQSFNEEEKYAMDQMYWWKKDCVEDIGTEGEDYKILKTEKEFEEFNEMI